MVLVPEGRQIFADMTVMENLVIGGYHNPDRRPGDRRRAGRCSRACASGQGSWRAPCPAASSRCWPSGAPWWRGPGCCCSTSPPWVWPPCWSARCFEAVAEPESPGRHGLPGRAERGGGAGDRGPGLRAGDGRDHPRRRGRATCCTTPRSSGPTWARDTRRSGNEHIRSARTKPCPATSSPSLQLERLQALLARLRRNVHRYREPFGDAEIASLDALSRLPVMEPDDLAAGFPYGLFALPLREVIRLQSIVGPGGRPAGHRAHPQRPQPLGPAGGPPAGRRRRHRQRRHPDLLRPSAASAKPWVTCWARSGSRPPSFRTIRCTSTTSWPCSRTTAPR